MQELYNDGNYIIFHSEDGYIVQNICLEGFAHSHIKNYKTCLWVIDLLKRKKCPYNIPKYLLISLIRLTRDEVYLNKLNNILDKKNNKKPNYYNSRKK